MRFPRMKLSLLFALAGLCSATLGASTVLHMNLDDLSNRAEKIFRGTVIDVTLGTVEAGGGEIPIVTYAIRVEDAIKGAFDEKDGVKYVEVRMLRDPKRVTAGDAQRGALFGSLPTLRRGEDYLLFTTAASAIGLSTTVGLGQGAFGVFPVNKRDHAANQLDNQGLFRGIDSGGLPTSGPIAYDQLVARIKSSLGQ